MKKIFGFFTALLMVFGLASCGVSASVADKINEAAKNDEHWTYSEVCKKLGDPTASVGAGSASSYTGAVTWVAGCDDWDDVEDKWEDGKTVKAIVVTFLVGKATSAVYHEDYKA